MLRAFPIGLTLAATLGLAAQAQVSSSPPPGAAKPPAAAATAPDPALKPGMPVKDATGAMIGSITQVGQTADGTPAVVVSVDGKPVGLPASVLTVASNGAEATASVTKAQIQGAAAPAKPPAG